MCVCVALLGGVVGSKSGTIIGNILLVYAYGTGFYPFLSFVN